MTKKRFDVELFVVHPTLTPAQISAALGIEAHFSQGVGEPKRTAKGPLPGVYPDTSWRHSVRHEVEGQHFADAIEQFVVGLEPHAKFLRQIRSSGGEAQVIVQFLGDGYFGDTIPHATLRRLDELTLDLGLECYVVPQR